MYETETVDCIYCERPTIMLGTRLCDRCWELERRIRFDLELAKKILAAVERELKEVSLESSSV